MDERIHRRDMIELAERRIEHVAGPKFELAGEIAWRTFGSKPDELGRQVDRCDVRAAPCCLEG